MPHSLMIEDREADELAVKTVHHDGHRSHEDDDFLHRRVGSIVERPADVDRRTAR